MREIDTASWREFRLGELFDIHPTKAYKMTNSTLLEVDGINPVVVNSSYNNGIGGYTNQKNTENGNMITFSDTTSSDAIFYQKKPFVGYAHVQGLYPISKYKYCWSQYSLLYLLTVFKKRAVDSNYDYVNKFTRELAKALTIKLPVDKDGNLDFAYMELYMQNFEVAVSSSLKKLQSAKELKESNINIREWGTFHLYDIFYIDSGTKLDKVKMDTNEPRINFVGRSNFNNGITQKVKEIPEIKPYAGGNLSLALGGAYLGSCFVQEDKFYTSQNVIVLKPKKKITLNTKQFIASAIFKESQNNYQAFIKELNAHIKTDFVIKLPVTVDGQPDYNYMDKYIRNIMEQMSNNIDCLQKVI